MAENNREKGFKDKNVYEHFDGFIETFLVNEKSYVLNGTSDKKYDIDEIKNAYKTFCDKSRKEGKDLKFDDVVKEYEKTASLEILNHAIFLWCLPNKCKSKWEGDSNNYYEMPQKNIAGGGSGYVQTKVNGVRFILYIFTQVLDFKSLDETKEGIIEICKQEKYPCDASNPNGEYYVPDGVKNLLLHMCNNNMYAPIASTSDKGKIVKAFCYGDIKKSDDNTLDSKIKDIIDYVNSEDSTKEVKVELKLLKTIVNRAKFSFYEDKVKYLWKGESLDGELSRAQLLKYKKAMVLYGPPGTGKTYTAMELAKELLVRDIVDLTTNSTKKDNLEDYFKTNIYYLQFHVNYTYDNFIAGQIIENNSIKTKKGFIFDVIDKANENNNLPVVVILDEMNRVDVSRVFGELFTAIEKRGTDVQLTLPDPDPNPNPDEATNRLVLKLPENVYFIGTMNEIDFSLEQIDFALRRRFVWELAGYDETALEDIISEQLDKVCKILAEQSGSLDGIDLDNYLNSCTNLNKFIETKLGKEFQIGHAFFAEVAKLYNECKKWDNAKNILWQMSIRPTIEAYCGAMDSEERESFVKECKEKFGVK